MHNILKFLMRQFVFFEGEPGSAGAGGTGGDAAAVAAAAAAAAAKGAAGAGSGGQPAWYDSFESQETKDWLKAYGPAYPNAEAVTMKALNLEKFLGAEKAGRGVIVPKADAKPEEWRAFYAKAGGVPEKPEGYKIENEKLAKDPILNKLKTEAHKIGMPPAMFNAITAFYGAEVAAAEAAQTAEFETFATGQLNELKTEWGGEYDKKATFGQRAVATFIPGSPEQRQTILNKMEGALGTKVTMQLWASIGEAIGEHGFIDGGASPNNGGMTPEAARMRINELKGDTEWGKKFINGGAEEKLLWDKLHRIGFPQEAG